MPPSEENPNTVDELAELVNNVSLESTHSRFSSDQDTLFKQIFDSIKEEFTNDYILSLRTQNGQTQRVERNYIKKIETNLKDNGITFKKAGTQQPGDFQKINGTTLTIEVKKTDSYVVKCNDTCPSKRMNYIIIYTGNNTFPPQIIMIKGQELRDTSPWVDDYSKKINKIKNEYSKEAIENPGDISVYARPNYSFNIKRFLKINN
tara:strand:- start:182 stop:796 length:615 start_codon:yes stop_codon:yes gene_type:complete